MTGERSKVRELDTTIQGSVKFGNNLKVRIEGKGMIIFQCKNSEQRKLKELYYIPELCNNIISLGQLSEGQMDLWYRINMVVPIIANIKLEANLSSLFSCACLIEPKKQHIFTASGR